MQESVQNLCKRFLAKGPLGDDRSGIPCFNAGNLGARTDNDNQNKHTIMATTRLFLDTRTLDSSGCGTLRLRISHRNTSTSTSLNIKLRPDQWDGAQIVNRPDRKTLDLIAQKRKSDADMVLFRMESGTIPMPRSATELMAQINETLFPEKYAPKVITYYDIYSKVVTKKKGTTRTCFECAYKKMQAFDPHIADKTFDELTLHWFEDFIAFMERDMKWNGMRNYLRTIRHVFNYARDENITTNYPFKRINMSPKATIKRTLSLDQLRRLKDMELLPWQEEYRDMFFLMFYLIGINAIDLFYAKKTQVVNGRLEYIRSKTGKPYSIKIEPEAQAIIDRYAGKELLVSPCERYADYKDYLHHMDEALKKIGMTYRPGLPSEGSPAFPGLTSYWSRHSWSTLAYELGISIDIVGQALGHSDDEHAITMVYIKKDRRKVDEANRAVIDAVTADGYSPELR